MLQSLSAGDLEDSLEHNIHHIQAIQAQIAAEISKLQEEPTQQAKQADQVASLQAKDQQLAEIMEEENDSPRMGVSFFLYTSPAGGGSKSPEQGHSVFISSG